MRGAQKPDYTLPGFFYGLSMDDIFNKAKELVRNNREDFEEATQSIIKKIIPDNKPLDLKKVSCRLSKLWPKCKGKEAIAFARLLSDTAFGIGRPAVPMAFAGILTKHLNDNDNDDEFSLNPANPQEWLRGHIFHEKESKERLEDAIRAYETEKSKRREILSPKAILIYEKLKSLPEYKGMTLPELQYYVEQSDPKGNTNLDDGTFKDIRKELIAYGLKNKKRIGYYIDG